MILKKILNALFECYHYLSSRPSPKILSNGDQIPLLILTSTQKPLSRRLIKFLLCVFLRSLHWTEVFKSSLPDLFSLNKSTVKKVSLSPGFTRFTILYCWRYALMTVLLFLDLFNHTVWNRLKKRIEGEIFCYVDNKSL